ncbi:MAG: tRNA uridine-5-carboxymethylaminomethyl(34) synthesis GTPase MnmE, partial [Candidatus Dadabacteria bacterium]
HTSDEIEHEGVKLAKEKAVEAELILLVLDGSEELDNDDIEVLRASTNKKAVIIINKSDLGIKLRRDALPSTIRRDYIVEISAKLGSGIEELKDKIRGLLTGAISHTDGSEIMLTELRHKRALEASVHSLKSFLLMLESEESPEFLAIDIRAALDSIGEITGEVTTEEILGRIFNKFCIGK